MELWEKRNFVNELIESTRQRIQDATAEMPEEWDGIELRQYIADKFADQARWTDKKRKAAYDNTMLVTNL